MGDFAPHAIFQKKERKEVWGKTEERTRVTGIAEEKPEGTLEIRGVMNRGEGE
jgi:hypothetical protein